MHNSSNGPSLMQSYTKVQRAMYMYHYLHMYNLWYLCHFTKGVFILYCEYIYKIQGNY